METNWFVVGKPVTYMDFQMNAIDIDLALTIIVCNRTPYIHQLTQLALF